MHLYSNIQDHTYKSNINFIHNIGYYVCLHTLHIITNFLFIYEDYMFV